MAQLYPVFVIIIIFLPIIMATSETERFYLKSQTSNLEYESVNNWKASGSINVLIQFETQTDGRIFTLLFKNGTGPNDIAIVFSVFLQNGKLMYQLNSDKSQINIIIADGKDHYIMLSIQKNRLSMKVDEISSTQYLPLTPDQQFDLHFVFGQYLDDQSIIGCVDINMNIDNKRDFKLVKGEIGSKCPTPCSSGQLKCKNEGKCTDVTLTTSACDCYGTNFGGDLCDKEPLIIVMNSSTFIVPYIGFVLQKYEHPTRIAFNLKPGQEMGRQDVFQTEFFLQPTEQIAYIRMYAYYQDQNFRLVTSDGVVDERFSLDPNNALWHSFTLNVDYFNRMLDISFDKKERKVQFGKKWLDWPFAHYTGETYGDFNFGAGPWIGAVNKFKGCLKNVFVDAFNIIEMAKSGNERVRSKDIAFGTCPVEKIEVSTTTIAKYTTSTPSSGNSLMSMSLSLFMIFILFL